MRHLVARGAQSGELVVLGDRDRLIEAKVGRNGLFLGYGHHGVQREFVGSDHRVLSRSCHFWRVLEQLVGHVVHVDVVLLAGERVAVRYWQRIFKEIAARELLGLFDVGRRILLGSGDRARSCYSRHFLSLNYTFECHVLSK